MLKYQREQKVYGGGHKREKIVHQRDLSSIPKSSYNREERYRRKGLHFKKKKTTLRCILCYTMRRTQKAHASNSKHNPTVSGGQGNCI